MCDRMKTHLPTWGIMGAEGHLGHKWLLMVAPGEPNRCGEHRGLMPWTFGMQSTGHGGCYTSVG
jgi:hypothetical protein